MENSPLNQLPAEVRNGIHELSFTAEEEIDLADPDEKLRTQPPITRTCKQIRSESLQLYFNTNKFRATIIPDYPWFEYTSADTLIIRDLKFDWTLAKLTAWLKSTPATCHQIISKVSIHTPDKMVGAEYWDFRKDKLAKLAEAFKGKGYGRDRVCVQVAVYGRVRCKGSPTHLERWEENIEKSGFRCEAHWAD